jgi:hypothetical protein
MSLFRKSPGWLGLLLIIITTPLGIAEDGGVSYKFGESPVPGLPQSGDWTTGGNWNPTICLQFDAEGKCIQKGYPGQQPANAPEYVFHKVTISPTPTVPPGPIPVDATLDLSVMASVAEVNVGTQTILNVGGQLGLNWWNLPIIGSTPDWKEAVLDVTGRVSVTGKIYSNGIMAITGPGTVDLLTGRIEANRLSNVSHIVGVGTITRLGATDVGFANSGTIDANFNGIALILDALPIAFTAYNAGTMRASNGGILRIQGNGPSTPSGVINNAGGSIKALTASRVELYSLDIRNGELSTEGSGRIEVVAPNVVIRLVTNTGLLNVNNGQQLTLGGSITNSGTIRLDSTSTTTHLRVTGTSPDDYSIGGNGVLELAHATRCIVTGAGTTSFGIVNGTDHTIRGTGLIEKFRRISNWGLMDADVTADKLKMVSTTSGSIGNTGVMRARNGATLEITGFDSSNPVLFNNAGGIIQAQNGSLVQISYATLTGGTLTTSGSGVIRLPTSVTAIGGLENLGTLDIRSSTTLLGGTLTNNGTMLLGSGSSSASLNIKPGAVLAGGGTLTMSNSPSNSIASAAVGTGTLVNEYGHTIQGSGEIGTYGMALTNRGLIQANQTNALILANSGAAASLANEGTLRVALGSTLQVNQNLANFNTGSQTVTGGRYEVLGTLRLPVAGGIVRNAADIVLDGVGARLYNGNAGTTDALAGFATNLSTGRFELRNGRNVAVGVFSNGGTLVLGSGSTFTSNQAFSQTAAGKTEVIIRGAPGTPANAGQLVTNAASTLDGTLHVHFDLSGGFTPAAGQSWRIVSGASIGGTFNPVSITGLPLTLQGSVTYVPGGGVDVTLASLTSFNYSHWAGNIPFVLPTDTTPDADPDHDGVSNHLEFAFLMDPLVPDAGKLPLAHFAAGVLGITFSEPVGITGVTYGAETSINLISWLPVPDTGSGGTHTFQQPAGGEPRLFMRHRVTLGP